MNKRKFEILLYGITKRTVKQIMELNSWDEDRALTEFAKSEVYSFLENEESKVWHYSPLMLAILFNDEKNGNLVFPEI